MFGCLGCANWHHQRLHTAFFSPSLHSLSASFSSLTSTISFRTRHPPLLVVVSQPFSHIWKSLVFFLHSVPFFLTFLDGCACEAEALCHAHRELFFPIKIHMYFVCDLVFFAFCLAYITRVFCVMIKKRDICICDLYVFRTVISFSESSCSVYLHTIFRQSHYMQKKKK